MARMRAFVITVLVICASPCLGQIKGDIPSLGLSTKHDCQAKGGQWKRQQAEGEEKCYFSSIEVCRHHGGIEDRDRRTRSVTCNFFLAHAKDRCVSEGGAFQTRGLLQSWGCVRPTKDGGKPCTDKRDCESACLYVGGRATNRTELVGQCAKDTNMFGCKTSLENGRLVRACVD
jgi:hypothetical protein